MTPDAILPTYDRVAPGWDRRRSRVLFERGWLDRMLGVAPAHGGHRRVLDLGCGSGRPIAAYLADRGCAVTGVDGAPAMVALFRQHLPRAEAVHADMRELALGRPFDAILAWNSFFHLAPADQEAMFGVFAGHAAPGAALMFTSGPEAGERMGEVEGQPVYHASLSPDRYRALLELHHFTELAFTPEDPDCAGHSVWLARYAR